MNSNHVDRPTTITASEFMAGGYDLKIKCKECLVFRDEDYQGEIVDIFPYYIGSKDLIAVYSDVLSEPSYVTGEEQLTVSWLPQPATSEPEAAAHKCNRCDGEGHVVAGWDNDVYENIEGVCPDCGGSGNAEIKRLQAENARLRNALKPFAEVEEETRESRYSVNELTGVTVLYGWLKQASAALAGHNSEPDHR